MPLWLNRARLLIRLSALFAALLIASAVVAPAAVLPSSATSAFAAPASDDSIEVSHTVDDEIKDEGSDEAADEAADEPSDTATDEAGDTITHEPSDTATDQPTDSATDEGSDPTADEPSDTSADEPSDPVTDEAVGTAADELSRPATREPSDPVTDAFLNRLLGEINHRRDRLGNQHLTYIPARANAALDGFLAESAPSIAWPGPCMHHLVGGAFSWDFVLAAGFGGEARGEVIACPGPEPYWTPDRAAEQWWESPIHFGVLYADPDANALACSAYGVSGGTVKGKNGKRIQTAEAASAVLCVTFRD
jgi:hypothetical protein